MGQHWLLPGALAAPLDPASPAALVYEPEADGSYRLVAVEYVVPLSLSSAAPAGFAGDADVWRNNSEGLGLWELNAWIWLNNSNGIFAFKNPRVPGDED